jgi:hypothetical protein
MKDVASFGDLRDVAREGLNEVQWLLHSPKARKARAVLASSLIVAAPAIARHPYMRQTKLLRLVGVAGGAALIVKVAETIRDWEPEAVAGRR